MIQGGDALNRKILLVLSTFLLAGVTLGLTWINNWIVQGNLEVPVNGSPSLRDIAGSTMILSYSNGGLDVVHHDTSPCGDATWTRRYRVRLGQKILVDLDDGEHHVIVGVEEDSPRHVKVHWERKEGQHPRYEEIRNQSGVFVTACEPDIILFDCRTVPPLHYTPDNITLARTLSKISEEEMDYLLWVANMTPEERQQHREISYRPL
jgi:hypothetical protein